ncbi:leucine Rich Repeat [Seminavis robusta]|uniref:Leucine Rich Repeat n=1 Tax=Seminavis robusta TaxID=568900 RepID=A0A9N8D7J5_9STRA|nr:leucine Rich Repeat [Seminavis robusta]|eukprot:Sro7_g006110.1 leucine Rich Repeat (409) ;mRNA; f:156265-157673
MQLEYDSPNLVQRFLLVLFYYQTTRHQPWHECNPPPATQGSATSGLCYKPHYLSGETSNNIWGDWWLSASHECQWAGITCGTSKHEEKRIIEVTLSTNQLNGPLPWEILQLAQLKHLELSYNVLTGTLSPRLFLSEYALTMEHLDLIGNRLTGTIPGEWFVDLHEGNGKLELLLIAENRLTGTIPSEVGLFPLRVLVAGRNALIGSLPMDLFYQSSLAILHVEDNQITGTIPTEIGLLASLTQINLSGNSISGSLPSEIGLAKGLTRIHLNATNMEGTLPEELYSELNNLRRLDLNGCNFSGTISSSLGLLTKLHWIQLANNDFHGTIPNEIETLTGLRQLLVNGNKLSGTVPVSVCQNFAYLEKNKHSEVLLVADCLPNTETGVPAIGCADDCCTSCCDVNGVCLAN